MSTDFPSRSPRNPFVAPDALTLQDVLGQVLAGENLSQTRRRDMASAIRTLGKALNQPLSALPAHPTFLRGRLEGFSPAAAGITASRWNNVRSLVNKALEDIGAVSVPGRYQILLTGLWQELCVALPTKDLRCGLSRLMHYCVANDIEPDSVDDALLDRFERALQDESLIKYPAVTRQRTCRAWNQARDRVQAWPTQKLTVPSRQQTYSLQWDAFSSSLHEDMENWLAVLSGEDLLAEETPIRPVKTSTVEVRRYLVRAFASALVHRGHDPASLKTLADLVEVETVKDGLRFFLERNKGVTSSHIFKIACMLKGISRHWVKVDEAHLGKLKTICRKLDSSKRGMTEKNRSRLRQFDHPNNVLTLLEYPQKTLERALASQQHTIVHARDVKVALAVELLLMAPLRISNICQISLDRHLVQIDKSTWHLVIPGHEVKNREDLEFPLPESTLRLLQTYLKAFRPLLMDQPSEWLFPGRNGKHIGRCSLGKMIKVKLHKATGLEVNPHLFRHIGAKLYLDANPGAYEVVRRVLGHRSMDTTTSFYTGLETAAAVRHFDNVILSLREGGPR